jgi:ParB-like chromosome segregation protein Spo0J
MRAREGGEVAWPADQVERWPLTKLIPYARNARTHSEDQIKQIAASIREFGFNNPVLVDEQGTLIAGHGRVVAAQLLGIADVPTMVARGWTHAQIQAYRLTDNQLALNAGWDRELLGLELGELKLEGFDLALTGFGELGGDLGEVGGEAPGVRPEPQCKQIGKPERRRYMQPIVTLQPHADREHRRDEAFQCFGCAR